MSGDSAVIFPPRTSKHSAASCSRTLPSAHMLQRCVLLPLRFASATVLPRVASLQSSTRCVVASVITPSAAMENSWPWKARDWWSASTRPCGSELST
jgi:hypothetical protein